MTLREQIIAVYPELEGTRAFVDGVIYLQDDSDGLGAYIREWNYEKPLPESLTQYLR
jgi:hypothetical protein